MDIELEMHRANVQGLSVCYFDRKEQWVKSFGVLQRGKAAPVTEDTLFHACSISKMVTAICVVKLASQGVLALERDVNEYLKTWKLGFCKGVPPAMVTLSMLLSHQAGLEDLEGSFEPFGANDAPVTNLQLIRGGTRFHAAPVRVHCAPGRRFAYSDAGYCVIRQVVEDATGKTMEYWAQELVFRPLGLSSIFFGGMGGKKNTLRHAVPRGMMQTAILLPKPGPATPTRRERACGPPAQSWRTLQGT